MDTGNCAASSSCGFVEGGPPSLPLPSTSSSSSSSSSSSASASSASSSSSHNHHTTGGVAPPAASASPSCCLPVRRSGQQPHHHHHHHNHHNHHGAHLHQAYGWGEGSTAEGEEDEDEEDEDGLTADLTEEVRGQFEQLMVTVSKQLALAERERLALARDRQELEQKRHAFEEMKKQMSSVLQLQENRVKLNVGGVKFVTSLDTLLMYPDSMLGIMFSGKYRLEKDEKGFFFIDRDGTHFRYILNFLRTGTLTVPEDPLIRRELQIEAEFYQIPALLQLLSHSGGEARFSKDLCHKNIVLDSTGTTATVATKGTCRVLVDTTSVHSGKAYWEFRLDKLQNPNCLAVGVSRTTSNLSTYVGSTKDGWSIIVMNRENIKKWNSPTCEEYGKGGIFREGDTIGLLLDFTGGERGILSFYINRVFQGEAFHNLPPHLFPGVALHSKGDQVSLVPFAKPPGDLPDA